MRPTPSAEGPAQDTQQTAEQTTGWAPEMSREVRLGLVLYGGVSLAIYINGVANEFFRAVRGRGVYRLIKELTDSDVAVDIISGTSAGGINGIFLAFCLCNEQSEFGRSARLWREHGDIRKLLRTPPGLKNTDLSLLNSEEYFLPKLAEALAEMYSSSERDPQELRSLVNELDLFITGTDVKGNTSTQFDAAGHFIHVKDHRSVFVLKHRKGRKDKEPFRPSNPEVPGKDLRNDVKLKALAKLASITSCFPSAFSPVGISKGADAELETWGRLSLDENRFLLDGGVLDNKPFSHTLRTIYSRHALNEVDRKLCYVEPVPEAAGETSHAEPTAPNLLQALVASLLGIPRYESISEDLKALAGHNTQVERYNRILSELWSKSGGAAVTGQASEEKETIYKRSRLVALSERVLRGIFRERGRDVDLDLKDPELRRRVEALVRGFEKGVSEGSVAEGLFKDLDVSFRLRRLYGTVYRLHDFLKENQDLDKKEHQRLWHVLNRQIELHEILDNEMVWLLDQARIELKKSEVESEEQALNLWHTVQSAFYRLLADSKRLREVLPERYDDTAGWDWLPPDTLETFRHELREHAKSIIPEIEKGVQSGTSVRTGQSLLHLFEKYEDEILKQFSSRNPTSPVPQAYNDFEAADTLLFPLELISGLREKDVIEAFRISPLDARRGFSDVEAKDKLTGDMAGNFSGFFKRSWRSNDILWGRLDGICQLVELLLTEERLKNITSNPSLRQKVRERMLKSQDVYAPDTLFPRAGAATHRLLSDWFRALLSADPKEREEALEADKFREMQTLLIEAAQLQVIETEMENILEDSREELASWKNSKLVSGQEAAKLETELARLQREFRNSLDSPAAAGARPKETALGVYFQAQRMGKETFFRDIPTSVLVDVAMATGTALQDGLLRIVDTTTSSGVGVGKLLKSLQSPVLLEVIMAVGAGLQNILLRIVDKNASGLTRFALRRSINTAGRLVNVGIGLVKFRQKLTLPGFLRRRKHPASAQPKLAPREGPRVPLLSRPLGFVRSHLPWGPRPAHP